MCSSPSPLLPPSVSYCETLNSAALALFSLLQSALPVCFSLSISLNSQFFAGLAQTSSSTSSEDSKKQLSPTTIPFQNSFIRLAPRQTGS